MKDTKIRIIMIVSALAGLCCFLGYRLAAQRAYWKRETAFNIAVNLGLYQAANRGDVQRVRSGLGMMIREDVLVYEQQFGAPTGTNTFAQKFSAARAIASQIQSNLVPVSFILSNVPHTPDAKITFEKQKD